MSVDGPTGACRVTTLFRIVGLTAAVAATCVGARADDRSPLPLTLERPSDGSAATLAAGAAALHVVFFATWCSPCVDEFRAMSEIESRWAAQGYRLVLVAVQARQSRERLATFCAASRPPGEMLFDATGSAQRAFAVDHLPTHLLIDPHGTVVHRSGSIADGVGPAVERLVTHRIGAEDSRR